MPAPSAVPDFDPCTHVDSLDALSVIVMLEQCDPDDTVLTLWRAHEGWWRNYRSNTSRPVGAPTKYQWCIRCLVRDVSWSKLQDPSAVVVAVKEGGYRIVAAAARTPEHLCQRCTTHTPVNPNWQSSL